MTASPLLQRLKAVGIDDVLEVDPSAEGMAAVSGLATRRSGSRVFVKTFAAPPPDDLFAQEAEGLQALRQLGGLVTPDVVQVARNVLVLSVLYEFRLNIVHRCAKLQPDVKLVGEHPMRKPIPPIAETVDDLKLRLHQERDVHKQQRLQMLYILASGQAQKRQQVAALLGVHRNTIGRWLASYAEGGLDALLAIYVASGKPLSVSPDVLASLEQALHQEAGFASYQALRQWVRQNHHLDIKYKTLYTIVRTRFKTKLKVPRPSHTKKP